MKEDRPGHSKVTAAILVSRLGFRDVGTEAYLSNVEHPILDQPTHGVVEHLVNHLTGL